MTVTTVQSEFDPVQVEVWRHLFSSIAEEMGAVLERTAHSPNIKERRDHSCAIFDRDGKLIAQAAHIPVHLGAMPLMMERLFGTIPWKPGVMWICNDPQHGGTHLPDFTLVMPIYLPDKSKELIGFVANRAHHADIGGLSPGSLPLSTELFHEGLIISPVPIVKGNRIDPYILTLICTNSRTPDERRGDLLAQISSNQVGSKRLVEMISRYGVDMVYHRIEEANHYSRHRIQSLIRGVTGTFEHADVMDSDGVGQVDIPIRIKLTLQDGRAIFDFTGTSPQVRGSINCTEAVTRSAGYYALRCLVGEEIPMNASTFSDIEVIAPHGTLINAGLNAAVAAGNVETSQRIVDVVFGALAKAFPGQIPADSQGTMNNLLVGGFDPIRNQPFAYYETVAGGAGASARSDGASAVQVHMTNTRNTPIEVIEMHYPLRVKSYHIRRNSGGIGLHDGGDGVVREIELLADCDVTVISERREHPPSGMNGGADGSCGTNEVTENGIIYHQPSKFSRKLNAGDTLSISTPGGGGFGTTARTRLT